MNVYTMAGGGAGDLIYHYFMQPRWRLIKPVKEKFPNVTITAVYCCHTGSEYELGFIHPDIESSLIYKWYPPGHELEYKWKSMISSQPIEEFANKNNIAVSKEQTELYLSETEKKMVKDICSEPYIAVHPFAGLPHRGCKKHPHTGTYRCYPDYKYIETIKLLKDKYKVIVIGRTNTSYDSLRANDEVLDLPQDDRIINMTNKGSLRTNVWIARNAVGFFGTHSAMLSAAWTNDVPSIFFYPAWEEGTYKSVRKYGGDTGTWAIDKPFHTYYEMKPEEFINDLKPEDVADKLLQNIEIKNV